MPIFKCLGCILLLIASALIATSLLAFERRRVTQAEGFLALIRFLRCQIDTLARPLPQILAECDASVLHACGWTAAPRPTSLITLLDGTALYLSEEICTLLYDFGRSLGIGYRDEQLRSCDYHLARLTPYCDTLRRDLPKKERVALFLPIAAALALILLLL